VAYDIIMDFAFCTVQQRQVSIPLKQNKVQH